MAQKKPLRCRNSSFCNAQKMFVAMSQQSFIPSDRLIIPQTNAKCNTLFLKKFSRCIDQTCEIVKGNVIIFRQCDKVVHW